MKKQLTLLDFLMVRVVFTLPVDLKRKRNTRGEDIDIQTL
jgi:hypothetical protein